MEELTYYDIDKVEEVTNNLINALSSLKQLKATGFLQNGNDTIEDIELGFLSKMFSLYESAYRDLDDDDNLSSILEQFGCLIDNFCIKTECNPRIVLKSLTSVNAQNPFSYLNDLYNGYLDEYSKVA